MSRSKKSIKNVMIAIVSQGIGILISFVARIVFIKTLGAEYLGLNGLFSNILTVLSLAELGVGEAITYCLYKPLAQNDKNKCKMLMQFYKKIYIIIGIIILVIGVSITPFLSYFIKEMPNIKNINTIYILFVINTAISYFFSYKRTLIIADQNRYVATLYRYTFYFILNFSQIIYLLLVKEYIGFLIMQISNTVIENIFISKKAEKMYPYLKEKDQIQLDKETKSEISKNTKAMMMHKLAGIVVSSTDNILLSKYISLTAVGIYSNYYMITNALTIIYNQIYSSILASVGNLCVKANSLKKYNVFKKLDFLTFWLYSFSSICLLCLINPFIEIWISSKYLLPLNIVVIIVINFYINGMRKSVLTFREATGLFYKDRWKGIIESIVNLIASIILVKKYGIFGIFLGTAISSITVCVWVEPFVLFKYGFNLNLKYYFKDYLKYLLITLVLGVITYYSCSMIILSSKVLSLIIKLIVCLMMPNIIIYLIFKNNESFKFYIDLIGNNLKKKKSNEK